MFDFSVVNIVFNGSLNKSIEIQNIACHFEEFKYEPKSFSGARIKFGKNAILLFRNGKYVSTGNKSLIEYGNSMERLLVCLKEAGIEASIVEERITNITAVVKLDRCLDPNLLQSFLGKSAIYEPELYPVVSYSYFKYNAKILFFHTGKIILTGAKSFQHLDELKLHLATLISEFNAASLH